jgi:hypothetical protein
VLCRTFEFRSGGAEDLEQRVPLPSPAGRDLVAAAREVPVYLTHDAAPAAQSAISAVEVRAFVRDGALVCRARLADFAAGDLVVVRVAVDVFRAAK